MASQGTVVTTSQLFVARFVTSWSSLIALDWGIKLHSVAWAPQRILRVNPAWLTEAYMAEIITLMLSTRQLLIAFNKTNVMALRI